MIQHYWISTWRNLRKNKLFALVNCLGLSVGVATFLVLLQYVNHHLEYNAFIPHAENIYRIEYSETQHGEKVLKAAQAHSRTPVLLKTYVPEVEQVTRMYPENALIFNEHTKLADQKVFFVDSTFLKVFNLEILQGNGAAALTPPNAMMISERQAYAYFGSNDAVGKTLFFNEHIPFTITGVFKNLPETTSLKFDFLLSWATMTNYGWVSREGDFNSPWAYTFVKLRPDVQNIEALNVSLTQLANTHITHQTKKDASHQYTLRSLTKLHFSSGLSGELDPGVSKNLLYGLVFIALFILIAAWINYINLSLAQAFNRAGEIGLRKVFGAPHKAIRNQFMLEAFVMALIAITFGLILYLIASHYLIVPLSGLNLSTLSIIQLGWILSGILLITLCCAAYPAYFLSKYKPAMVIKNQFMRGSGRTAYLRQGLVIVQLFLSVTTISISLIASSQIKFIRAFDTGFQGKHTLSLRAPASTNSDPQRLKKFQAFRDQAIKQAGIISGTASMNIPGQELRFHDENIRSISSENIKKRSFQIAWVDEAYLKTFGIPLISGRNFSETDHGNTCVINEAAAQALGFAIPEDAVNQNIVTGDGKQLTIIGVIQNFHHESIKKTIEPMLLYNVHPHEFGFYSFSIEFTRSAASVETLKTIWNTHFPHDPFLCYFTNSFFANQYADDFTFDRLLKLFTTVSLVVSVLGLFALSSLFISKRIREVGVRKVLGASSVSIMLLLSRDYLRLAIVAFILALPGVYFFANNWLESFSYRITLEVWMVIVPGLLLIALVLLSIGLQAFRATQTNPAEVLHND